VVIGDKIEIEHKTKAAVIAIPFTMPGSSFAVEFCLDEQ
jgi:CheY-specific phosphatase CheX